jgi:hypothetical protein
VSLEGVNIGKRYWVQQQNSVGSRPNGCELMVYASPSYNKSTALYAAQHLTEGKKAIQITVIISTNGVHVFLYNNEEHIGVCGESGNTE